MGFYVRKSLKAGPFRFNLSKSGLGVSAGVPGFRVGSGPRGNYVHMGANGLYYRATVGAGAAPRARTQIPAVPPNPIHQVWNPSSVALQDITGSTVQNLEPSGPGDLVTELNRAAQRFGAGWPTSIALFLLGLILMPWGLILWALSIPLCWWLFLRDGARKSAIVFYDVNDASAEWYQALVDSSGQLTASQHLWRLAQSGAVQTVYQHKTNAGAGQIVSRLQARSTHASPKSLVTNVSVPSLEVGKVALHFLPDRILVRDGKQYSDVAYDRLSVHFNTTRFIESTAGVPTDAEKVGQTWQYVNVKGGPDRRFANNPVLPIMLYGEVQLRSDTGLRWDIQGSSVAKLQQFSDVLRARKNMKLPAI